MKVFGVYICLCLISLLVMVASLQKVMLNNGTANIVCLGVCLFPLFKQHPHKAMFISGKSNVCVFVGQSQHTPYLTIPKALS